MPRPTTKPSTRPFEGLSRPLFHPSRPRHKPTKHCQALQNSAKEPSMAHTPRNYHATRATPTQPGRPLGIGSCSVTPYGGTFSLPPMKTLGLLSGFVSNWRRFCVQHLLQDATDLLDRRLFAADVLLLVILLGRSLDRDVRELAGEQDRGLQPG